MINQFGSEAVVLTSQTAQQYLPSNYFHPPLSNSIGIELFGGECCEEALLEHGLNAKPDHKSVKIGSSIHHEGGHITVEMVYDALIKADAFGRQFI